MDNQYDIITEQIEKSILVKRDILNSKRVITLISKAANCMIEAYRNGNKVILCGNGGSASDALHMEAELVGRYKMNRKALPALAIVSSPSIITAVGNDYGYDSIFDRQIEAFGAKGDILLAISTSGSSVNVIKGVKKAKEIGMTVISMTGKDNSECCQLADIAIQAPSDDTPRIQEAHIMIVHILCDLVEKELFD